jgi:hypothetical protein
MTKLWSWKILGKHVCEHLLRVDLGWLDDACGEGISDVMVPNVDVLRALAKDGILDEVETSRVVLMERSRFVLKSVKVVKKLTKPLKLLCRV